MVYLGDRGHLPVKVIKKFISYTDCKVSIYCPLNIIWLSLLNKRWSQLPVSAHGVTQKGSVNTPIFSCTLFILIFRSVPKFMKRIKVPDYKDKNVFGVPLIVHVQRTGQPLPQSIQQALRYLRSNCLDQVWTLLQGHGWFFCKDTLKKQWWTFLYLAPELLEGSFISCWAQISSSDLIPDANTDCLSFEDLYWAN